MKTTDHFKSTILTYLENRALTDTLFAPRFNNPSKNIDDCVSYILNTVKESGYNGFADDEVYSMAVHYYDEENIEVGKAFDCRVVVNHTVELTEEEKQEARQKAIDSLQREFVNSMRKNPAKNNPAKKEETPVAQQGSLF
jgi:uncharacterized protein (UPF0248 family)